MKTAMIVNRLGGGGAQRSAILIAENWPAAAGHCSIIAARTGTYASAIPAPEDVSILSPNWPSPFSMLLFAFRLRRHLMTFRIDVVVTHVFGLTHLVLALRALRIIRSQVVVVEQNHFSSTIRIRFGPIRRRLIVELTKVLYRRAERVVAVSWGVARDLEAILGRREGSAAVIYNPIDVEKVRQSTQSDLPNGDEPRLARQFQGLRRPIVISVGRLEAQKDHATLLRAVAQTKEVVGSLVILGDGSLRSEIETTAHDLGIRATLWLPGFVNDPWWFMARSDVFVLSSVHEGFGNVIVEALACGLPVVSTDCESGPAEILRERDDGSLVPVADAHALANKIRQRLRSPARHGYSANLQTYDPKRVAMKYAALCASIHGLHRG